MGYSVQKGQGLRNSFAANVRIRRKALKMSQQDLADAAEIDRTYASRIERGIANPSLMVVENIAKALSTSAVDLLK